MSFFYHDTNPHEISSLSLPDALPILRRDLRHAAFGLIAISIAALAACQKDRPNASDNATTGTGAQATGNACSTPTAGDRKSTRLNSSHPSISYAVVFLKKKKLGLMSA